MRDHAVERRLNKSGGSLILGSSLPHSPRQAISDRMSYVASTNERALMFTAARRTCLALALIALLASSTTPALADGSPAAESDRTAAQRAARLASMKLFAAQMRMRE